MRINKFVALATGISRRAADEAIKQGRVTISGQTATQGQEVHNGSTVSLDDRPISIAAHSTTIVLNKPVGYVVSRHGQGSRTIYDLLPEKYQNLKPVGRLDKDSSGLLLLTDDGNLAHELTHPSFQKDKVYEVELDRPLESSDKQAVEEGVDLDDGKSALALNGSGKNWSVTMYEGRNRQIRRTFAALGYRVTKLHRLKFGDYKLGALGIGKTGEIL